MTQPIVITGAGIVSAIGIGKAETLKSLLEVRHGIAQVQYLNTVHRDFPVGEVKLSNEELQSLAGTDSDNGIQSRNALIARLAVREALIESGLADSDGNAIAEEIAKMAFISGTTVAGMDRAESMFTNADPDVMKSQMLTSGSDCGSNTVDIARAFGSFAMLDTISTACSSAANAIIFAANLIKAGRFERIIAGGTESLSRLHFNGFNTLMILDREQCRPFDQSRAGLNLGEGAGYLVIESLSSALKRGAKPLAVISGYGNTCDAYHQTASSPEGNGAFLAMSQAIQMAGLKPTDIDYINAHGTGTPNNDISELTAMKRLFAAMPPYSSTKAFTGHTTSASGSIEAIFCLLALQHQFLPAGINCHQVIEDCPVPVKAGDKPAAPLRHILCNAFGFGGNDSSLVLSCYEAANMCEESACSQSEPFAVKTTLHKILDPDTDPDFKQYMSAGDARRLGRMLKRTLSLSIEALRLSGIERPDAIITGTAWGSIESSELFLRDIINYGEEMLKPTHFMQSTHNTLASLVAIQTANHGYNCTHSQGEDSLKMALLDAKVQIQLGLINSALVGFHDALPGMTNEVYLLERDN